MNALKTSYREMDEKRRKAVEARAADGHGEKFNAAYLAFKAAQDRFLAEAERVAAAE